MGRSSLRFVCSTGCGGIGHGHDQVKRNTVIEGRIRK